MPIVSVIIPNFNKGTLVRHSLESLLRQTYGRWEAIVVDDGSTDESWEIVREFAAKDARIVALRNETNRGGCYSRNRGAKVAKGEYLIFLDSDDWLSDDCLERRVEEFEREENRSFDMLIFEMATSRAGKIEQRWNYGNRKNALLSFLRHEIVWSIMMPIWWREAFERFGGFDEAFPRLQDVELHTRALLHGLTYRFADRKTPDCFYFVDETRMTTNHEEMSRKFVDAILAYVSKMRVLVRTREERAALAESLMAAICWVNVHCQTRKISRRLKSELLGRIFEVGYVSFWVRVYAWLCSVGCNRTHGFNFLYHRIYRIV